jgi:hypothetical protein
MRFKHVVNQFQDEVKSNKMYIEVQTSTKENAKDFCSQIESSCLETDKLKKRLHSVTQENLELRRVLQDLNKACVDRGVQTPSFTQDEQLVNSTSALPFNKYVSTFEKKKESQSLKQSCSNGNYLIFSITNYIIGRNTMNSGDQIQQNNYMSQKDKEQIPSYDNQYLSLRPEKGVSLLLKF